LLPFLRELTLQETKEHIGKWVATEELKNWEENPRNNKAAIKKVADSIKRFGFAAPIIARMNGTIIAGHTRLAAAKLLKLPKVPVRFMDLDPADAKLLALADNKLAEIAEWNQAQLIDLFTHEQFDLDDLNIAGFNLDEVDDLLNPKNASDILKEIEELEQEEEETELIIHSKVGEIYELGNHRLICGDCKDGAVVEKLLNGEKINVAITSPPYASQRKYDSSSGFQPIHPDNYVDWFNSVQSIISDHLAKDGSFFLNIKENCDDGQRVLYVKDLVLAHVRRWKWLFIDELIWTHNGVPGGFPSRFKNAFEPIFHFAKGKIKFRKYNVAFETDHLLSCADIKDEDENTLLRRAPCEEVRQGKKVTEKHAIETDVALPSNVLSFGVNREGLGHSAAFPINLPEFFIKAYSDEKDIIYDPFMGSGTTLIAAAVHKRIAFGCEISPKYCDIIRRRWTKYAKSKDIDVGSGGL
jgi:DNA modification methylase